MSEQLSEETQIELEKAIEPKLKADIELVQEELKKLSDGKEYKTFDIIEPELIEKLCNENEIIVYPQFKDAMNTPFAIAKYLNLKAEAESLASEIDFDISTFIDKEKVDWVVHKDLTNEITFTKKSNDRDEMPQSLVIKYRKDALTGKTIYSIKSNNWCWDISKNNLKALVESGELVKDIPTAITSLKPTIKTLSDNEFISKV
jgi:hypothetical protein